LPSPARSESRSAGEGGPTPAKRLNAEVREIETNNLTEDLEERIRVLDGLLSATLDVDDYIEFESLKEEMVALPFAAGELGKEEPKPRPEAFLPPEPGAVGRLFGVRKYEEQKKKGMLAHEQP
jgi:restriction system protein